MTSTFSHWFAPYGMELSAVLGETFHLIRRNIAGGLNGYESFHVAVPRNESGSIDEAGLIANVERMLIGHALSPDALVSCDPAMSICDAGWIDSYAKELRNQNVSIAGWMPYEIVQDFHQWYLDGIEE